MPPETNIVQPRWIATLKGSDAIEIHKQAHEQGVDAPQPLCSFCKGAKRMTGYAKLEFDTTPEVLNFWKRNYFAHYFLKSDWFRLDNHIYVVINTCPDCLGFYDSWRGNRAKSDSDYSATEIVSYQRGYNRGMKIIARQQQPTPDTRANRIKKEIGLNF